MTDRATLTALMEKLEAGERISYDDIDPICAALIKGATFTDAGVFYEACEGKSFDAVQKLHEMVLPEWLWNVWKIAPDKYVAVLDGPRVSTPEVASTTPARAWLIAIVKALIAMEDGG